MTEPTHHLDAFQAARDWATEHGHAQPDDRMLEAYGRVLVASLPAVACPCTCHHPERCPCTPGAPTHRHGAGGYCTAGDRSSRIAAAVQFARGAAHLEAPVIGGPVVGR